MTHKVAEAPGAQDIFQTAHSVLGYDLQELCLKGPEEQLNQTVHCQPAVVVGSLVGLSHLEQVSPEVSDSQLWPRRALTSVLAPGAGRMYSHCWVQCGGDHSSHLCWSLLFGAR